MDRRHDAANSNDDGYDEGAQQAAAPAAEPEVDPYEKIKQAKELLDAGVLTEEEFEAEKKKYLGD